MIEEEKKHCTCAAGDGGESHEQGCPQAIEIWTPPEKLDANTTRMAWLLFLEAWKDHLPRMFDEKPVRFIVPEVYDKCLETAKIVRRLEQG